jgi:hypothetical protein
VDFVVCTLAVGKEKNQGRFRYVGSDHSLVRLKASGRILLFFFLFTVLVFLLILLSILIRIFSFFLYSSSGSVSSCLSAYAVLFLFPYINLSLQHFDPHNCAIMTEGLDEDYKL